MQGAHLRHRTAIDSTRPPANQHFRAHMLPTALWPGWALRLSPRHGSDRPIAQRADELLAVACLLAGQHHLDPHRDAPDRHHRQQPQRLHAARGTHPPRRLRRRLARPDPARRPPRRARHPDRPRTPPHPAHRHTPRHPPAVPTPPRPEPVPLSPHPAHRHPRKTVARPVRTRPPVPAGHRRPGGDQPRHRWSLTPQRRRWAPPRRLLSGPPEAEVIFSPRRVVCARPSDLLGVTGAAVAGRKSHVSELGPVC